MEGDRRGDGRGGRAPEDAGRAVGRALDGVSPAPPLRSARVDRGERSGRTRAVPGLAESGDLSTWVADGGTGTERTGASAMAGRTASRRPKTGLPRPT